MRLRFAYTLPMPTRPLSKKDREILERLRHQLSEYFAEELGSRNRALRKLGVHHSTLDKAFQSGSIQVSFLSQILDELGLSFEDLVSDAFGLGSPRGKEKIRAQKRVGTSDHREFAFAARRRLREIEDEKNASGETERTRRQED